MVGYNDTIQTPHAFGGPREQLWGFGPLGLQLWNSIRVVDFLQSLPDVDPERIGATGASGGGTQTFLLSAVDDRIKFAAPVNMLSAIMQGGSPCENAPNLRVGAFNLEIGAMMAPAAAADGLGHRRLDAQHAQRGVPRHPVASTSCTASRRTWKRSSSTHRTTTTRTAARPSTASSASTRWASTTRHRFRERNFQVEKLQDLLALHNRKLPDNALTYEQIVEQWVSRAKAQSEASRDREAARERLAFALTAEWPAKVVSETAGERILLSRAGAGDRIPGIFITGKGVPALVVGPDGAEAARATPQVKALVAAGRPVLLIDAFQTGSAVAKRDTSARHFLTFNKTDDANRVQDILTALAFLNQPGVKLVGLGKAAVWCQFAAAVAKVAGLARSGPGGLRRQRPGLHRPLLCAGHTARRGPRGRAAGSALTHVFSSEQAAR